MNRHDCWRQCFEGIADQPSDFNVGHRLLDFWMTYGLTSGECSIGHGFKNDIAVFADALRRHLPPYQGPDMTLYRGQLEIRHLAGIYGIAWTSKLETAKRFATYHSAGEGPAVVLHVQAEALRIIALPGRHSRETMDEHEYIIDPRGIQPQVIQTIQDYTRK